MVLAIIDQGACRILSRASDAPEGAVVFKSSKDLEKLGSIKTLDNIRIAVLRNLFQNGSSTLNDELIRRNLLKEIDIKEGSDVDSSQIDEEVRRYVARSKSVEQAALRLWQAINVDEELFTFSTYLKVGKSKTKLGTLRSLPTGRTELMELIYEPGKDPIIDHFYERLLPQAKCIIDMLMKDGRRIWTGEELKRIVFRNRKDMHTRQDPLLILNYYRGSLINKKMLRRVTYQEFSEDPRFAGKTLESIFD